VGEAAVILLILPAPLSFTNDITWTKALLPLEGVAISSGVVLGAVAAGAGRKSVGFRIGMVTHLLLF
jgi:hypothetical protein